MTTITIDNPNIEQKYTKDELKILIYNFLQSKIKEDTLELFEISIDDLDNEAQKAYKKSFNDVFIEY